MLLNDQEIKDRVGMIDPFVDHKVRSNVVSYGLGHMGYDFSLAPEWTFISWKTRAIAFLKSIVGIKTVLDPKVPNSHLFTRSTANSFVIPAHGNVLARTNEHWSIPTDITVVVLGKSTYARLGLILNVTPFESGWKGYATIELHNASDLPIRVHANEGIGQALFLMGNEATQPYHEDGKYQNQPAEVVLAKIENVVTTLVTSMAST
jgi:dCTP deaminase